MVQNTSNIDELEQPDNGIQISAKRIGQIRAILNNTTQRQVDSILTKVNDNKKKIIHATQKDKTMTQLKYLKEFINNYIASLNSAEILELTAIIEYYEELFDKHSIDIKVDTMTCVDYYKIPLGQRIERLLQYGSILPNNKNKYEFMTEMDIFVERLRNDIDRRAKEYGFYLTYTPADVLMDFIREAAINETVENQYSMYDYSYGTEVKGSYLKSVNFNLSLPELYGIENGAAKTNEMFNSMKFELVFTRELDEGITMEEFTTFINESCFKNDGNSYILGGNDHIQIKMFPYNKVIYDDGSERFTVEIYSQPLKNNISSELFVELSIPEISFKAEGLINNIYRHFGHPKHAFLYDMDGLIDRIENEEDNDGNGLLVKNTKSINSNNPQIDKPSYEGKVSSDIILKQTELETLEIIIDEINNPDDYKNAGIKPTKGIVLHGPAGTGKTLFAEHISSKTDSTFMVIKSTQIVNEYVGVSERKLDKKFEEARALAAKTKKRVVMFFDEADSLFEKSGSQDNHKGGMINIFLSATDGIDKGFLDNIVIIFTTNRIGVIPEAILDRLNLKLKIDLPDKDQRVKHFKLNIDNINKIAIKNNFDDIDYEYLANKTEGKSGRFINRLIENTVRNFVRIQRTQENKQNFLITTQDIIEGIKLVEALENSSKGIGFHTNI